MFLFWSPSHAQQIDNLKLVKGADVCSFDSVSIQFDGKTDQELTKIAADQLKDFNLSQSAIFNGVNSSCFLLPVLIGDFYTAGNGSYIYNGKLLLKIRMPYVSQVSTANDTPRDTKLSLRSAEIYTTGYFGSFPMTESLQSSTVSLVKQLLGSMVTEWRKSH